MGSPGRARLLGLKVEFYSDLSHIQFLCSIQLTLLNFLAAFDSGAGASDEKQSWFLFGLIS